MLTHFLMGRTALLCIAGLSFSLLSACAVHGGPDKYGKIHHFKVEGVSAPSDINTPEGQDRLTRNFQNTRRCLYSITRVRNFSNKSVTITAGMDVLDSDKPYADFTIVVPAGKVWVRSSTGNGSKSDPDLYANPGKLTQISIDNGSRYDVKNIDVMPLNCSSHPDKNKRFFSATVTVVGYGNAMRVSVNSDRHY